MFKGIFTPIVTPFTEGGEIDYDKLRHNLKKWGNTDLEGIVVLGSNGEFPYMTKEEKINLVKFVKENFNNDKKIIVGTSCESTVETIELSKSMAKLKADAVLILPPHYYKGNMKDDVLYSYFIEVAENCPIPILLYNMPKNTGINLFSSLVAKLAKHPNIVGIKDTSGNIVQITEIIRDTTGENFSIFAGNAGYLLPALAVGAKGATLALANILPDDCCKLYNLFNEGNIEKAKEIQHRLLEINYTVTGDLGIPGLKAAMDLLGYKGGFPRKPLMPLNPQNLSKLKKILKDYGAI